MFRSTLPRESTGATLVGSLVQGERQAFQQLRAAADLFPTPLLVTDLQSGTVLFANRAVEELFGLPPLQPLHRKAAYFYADSEDRQRLIEMLTRTGAVNETEIKLRRRDGSTFWAAVTARVMHLEQGRSVVAITLSDRTAVRAAHRALGRSEQSFRQLVDGIPAGIAVVDRRGSIRHVNRRLASMFGYRPSELVGASVDMLVPEGARSKDAAARSHDQPHGWAARPTGVARSLHGRRKDGTSFPVDVSLSPLHTPRGRCTVAAVRDITGQREVERDLWIKTWAIASANRPMLLVTRDGRVSYANRAGHVLLSPCVSGSVEQCRLADIIPEAAEGVQRCLREGRWEDEVGVRIGDRIVPLEVSAHTVYTRDGHPLQVFVHLADITRRREIEAQLHQACKLHAVGQFAGGVAHDFNNVLTAILGNAQMLAEDSRLPSDVRQDLRDILSAGHHASDLVHRLLAFSRKQVLRPQIINVGKVLGILTRMLQRLLPASIRIETDTDAERMFASIDATQLEQVVLNLAVNARDAMPDGGILHIQARSQHLERDHAWLGEDLEPGAHIIVSVRDTGAGIPHEHLDKIFDPFFTTKEVGQGTGLGLASAYGAIAQSGGAIRVQSRLGEGSCFHIVLPQHEGEGGGVGTDEVPDGKRA